MNTMMSENELLKASLAGDKEAFGLVVQKYQALVCALTYSATGDIGRSEELAQETFIRAWRRLRQLESPTKLRAWLCTIARNLAYSAGRKISRDVSHAAGSLEGAATLPASTPGPDEVASERERQEMVWRAVGGIDPKYREPLVLFYRRGQSVSEVAADLELSEDTVRQRLHRGRQLIKAEVSSLVEDTLIRSGPGKTFAVAVVAALPAMITPPASAAVVGVAARGVPTAKTLAATGLIGAILGPILGLPGGVFGSWLSSKFAGSARQRQLMIRIAAILWLLLFALAIVPLLLVLTGLVPGWVLKASLATFLVLQLVLILWSILGPRRIQIEEGTHGRRGHWWAHVPRAGLYGSFGGAIWGASLCWLYPAWLAKDWLSVAAILAGDILIFFAVTRIWIRRLRQ